jgi:hypothetical protein
VGPALVGRGCTGARSVTPSEPSAARDVDRTRVAITSKISDVKTAIDHNQALLRVHADPVSPTLTTPSFKQPSTTG